MAIAKSPNDRLSKLQALKLQQSVNTKDVSRIIKLITNGVPNLVNIPDSNEGVTGIHLAACANDENILKLLFRFGADCNIIDNNGKTAYMKAAEYGHLETLALLLNVCDFPDLEAKDTGGRNILFYCLHGTKRHQLCLKLAIDYGANVHVIGNNGKSLLLEACELKLTGIMQLLLNAGIDVNGKNEQTGETSLHIACKAGLTEIARMLLRHGANPDICDRNNFHCAHKAAKGDHLEILQLLSAYRGNLGPLNIHQETPMHIAAHKGLAAVCKFLGQRGCPANLKNAKGYTPRTLAKNSGHKLATKACKKAEKQKGLKPGTQFNIVQFYDWLQENIEFINIDVEEHDPEKTGKIKSEDMLSILKKHKSPLDEENHIEILRAHDKLYEGVISYDLFFSGKKFIHKLFLTKGAKQSSKGEKNKGGRRITGQTKIELPICTNTKLKYVRPENSGPLANFIERQELVTDRSRFHRDHQPTNQIHDDSYWYIARYDPTFIHVNEAVKNNDKETLKSAINNGYDVNEKDQYYKTPLMHACLDGNYELVKFLLENGAEINAMDNFKWSAIHFACHSGQKDLVELLINNGADIDSQTLCGGTPLMRAIESASVDVVQLLIDRDAKVHIETKKGLKALQIAKAYSDLRIINIIEKRISEVPPPIVKRKRKFSPIKLGANKVGINPTILPDIKSSNEVILPSKPETDSLARAASALENSVDVEQEVTFQVQKAWLPQLNTNELLSEKNKMRERYGDNIDFEDYKPPFQENIDKLLNTSVDAT